MNGKIILPLLLWHQLVFPGFGENILLIPLSTKSHIGFFCQLGIGLQAEGHQVTLLIRESAKVPAFLVSQGVNFLKYNGSKVHFLDSEEANELLMRTAVASESWIMQMRILQDVYKFFQKNHKQLTKDCDGLLQDQRLFESVKNENHSFAIVDFGISACYHAYAYKLNIPYASFSLPVAPNFYRVPALASQTFVSAMPLSHAGDNMNFFSRLTNFLLLLSEYFFLWMLTTAHQKYFSDIAPGESLTGPLLVQNSKLWFYLNDPVIGNVMPLMPNTVEIADIMGREAYLLPLELENLISSAKAGAIIVSLGSRLSRIPEEISSVLFEGLKQTKFTVIMKKLGNSSKDLMGNIHLLDWLPQNDLLSHQNVKLFISHCGISSLIETVYHAVPMLAIPLQGDQFQNADRVEARGLGKQLKLGLFTADVLADTIKSIVDNQDYAENALKLSRIFRDKPQTAAARASHAIKHVIKHGDGHLRTKAFNLSLYEFMMLDIYVFLLAATIIGATVMLFCVKRCFQCIHKMIARKSLTKVKKS